MSKEVKETTAKTIKWFAQDESFVTVENRRVDHPAPQRWLLAGPSLRVIKYNYPHKGQGEIVVLSMFRCDHCVVGYSIAYKMEADLGLQVQSFFLINHRTLSFRCSVCAKYIPAHENTDLEIQFNSSDHHKNIAKANGKPP